VAALPPAAAAFLSRHVALVFTGTCRLAATVARGVVDAWQRRTPGVEEALRQCAAVGVEMTEAMDRLGALPQGRAPGTDSSPPPPWSYHSPVLPGSLRARETLLRVSGATSLSPWSPCL